MKALALGALALGILAGCAGSQQQPQHIPTSDVSDVQLCRYTLYGNPRDQMVAQDEANRRRVDCRTYYPAILGQQQQQLQQQQQRNESANQAFQYFRPPPPPPVQRQCTSQWHGSQLVTVCD
jgi:hypothetical protein